MGRRGRSLKKETKLKAKKAQAWGERQAHQRKEQAAKQAKCGPCACPG